MAVTLEELGQRAQALRDALGRAVVGQHEVVDELMVALLAGGHVLLEGVPGVAKTRLARALSQALGLTFRRIQFTPDLMPADVTGTRVFDFSRGVFELQKGPVFTQVLLADEINRAPPKTQAALLESMQEGQVTIDGERHQLAAPFVVLATQNPLDHEGTFPLPEAQMDRFLLHVLVGYPRPEDELEVYRRYLAGTLSDGPELDVPRVLADGELLQWQAALSQVHVAEEVLGYLRELVQATREAPELVAGASPRAALAWLAAARAHAALEGRAFVTPDDLKALARPVLRHRLLVTPEAELDGRDGEAVLERILSSVAVPQ